MKVGFVSIIGRPNVGKSTLLNTILNYNLSIISSKPQTTRDSIKGIYNDEDSQIIFIDTPGIHKPKSKFGNSLNFISYSFFKDIDLILFLTPIDEILGPGDKKIIQKLDLKKTIAIITKRDKGNLEKLNIKIKNLQKISFKDILSTSFKENKTIDFLIDFLKQNLTPGIRYYDKNVFTDKSTIFLIKEKIRESVIENVYDEIPHSIAILVEEFEKRNDYKNLYYLKAFILVESLSQKKIVIGQEAKKIKKIGTQARKNIEQLINKKIFLDLKVKIYKNWTKNLKKIKKIGY